MPPFCLVSSAFPTFPDVLLLGMFFSAAVVAWSSALLAGNRFVVRSDRFVTFRAFFLLKLVVCIVLLPSIFLVSPWAQSHLIVSAATPFFRPVAFTLLSTNVCTCKVVRFLTYLVLGKAVVVSVSC